MEGLDTRGRNRQLGRAALRKLSFSTSSFPHSECGGVCFARLPTIKGRPVATRRYTLRLTVVTYTHSSALRATFIGFVPPPYLRVYLKFVVNKKNQKTRKWWKQASANQCRLAAIRAFWTATSANRSRPITNSWRSRCIWANCANWCPTCPKTAKYPRWRSSTTSSTTSATSRRPWSINSIHPPPPPPYPSTTTTTTTVCKPWWWNLRRQPIVRLVDFGFSWIRFRIPSVNDDNATCDIHHLIVYIQFRSFVSHNKTIEIHVLIIPIEIKILYTSFFRKN